MVGLPCLVSKCAKLHLAGWTWAVFTRIYLESCAWPVAIFMMDQRGTASVHSILCQSWEKCYRDPHRDLQGPKLESCTGVSMACPVQDWSHISWRWRTHGETHKLHNSRNCCMNSRAHPSGSTSDHSQHCWGGGNWLWDMPTGSDGRIGHAPCRSQICAQDPDSWSVAAACQHLQWTSSACLRRWKVLVQGHHWWWELGLRLRPWDKATVLPVEKPHVAKAKKKSDRWKAISSAWLSLSLASRGLCTKNLSQQAKLWILGSAAKFCGDCVKTCEDIAPNFGENRPGCLTMTVPHLTLSSSPTSSWRKTKLLLSPTHCTPLISHPVTSSYFWNWNWSWKDAGLIPLRRSRPNRREFLTLWQKRTSRNRSKNGGDVGTGVYMREGTSSRVTAAGRP